MRILVRGTERKSPWRGIEIICPSREKREKQRGFCFLKIRGQGGEVLYLRLTHQGRRHNSSHLDFRDI